jgi:ribosomal protein S18 acetylase RimI-like enzyme
VSVLEIRRLAPGLEQAACTLLAQVAGDPHGRFFTPHPFTREHLTALAASPGRDLYHVLLAGDVALAYGLLRGWNEGYAVPSLGLAVAPAARGGGLGRLMMEFLHAAARHQGARRIRLRVGQDNAGALALYQRCGYRFPEPADAQGLLVGFCELVRS